MENAAIFGWTLLWILFLGRPRRRCNAHASTRVKTWKSPRPPSAARSSAPRSAPSVSSPCGLPRPKSQTVSSPSPSPLSSASSSVAFALADPDNLCVVNGSFVISQLANGIVHRHYLWPHGSGPDTHFLNSWCRQLRPRRVLHDWRYGHLLYDLTLASGRLPPRRHSGQLRRHLRHRSYLFERIFLRPMGSGQIERPTEYAILVTFGLAFFLQYFTQALTSAVPVKNPALLPLLLGPSSPPNPVRPAQNDAWKHHRFLDAISSSQSPVYCRGSCPYYARRSPLVPLPHLDRQGAYAQSARTDRPAAVTGYQP